MTIFQYIVFVLLWALWYTKHPDTSYYAFYTERWADKLGGVTHKR